MVNMGEVGINQDKLDCVAQLTTDLKIQRKSRGHSGKISRKVGGNQE